MSKPRCPAIATALMPTTNRSVFAPVEMPHLATITGSGSSSAQAGPDVVTAGCRLSVGNLECVVEFGGLIEADADPFGTVAPVVFDEEPYRVEQGGFAVKQVYTFEPRPDRSMQ